LEAQILGVDGLFFGNSLRAQLLVNDYSGDYFFTRDDK
jgi:hypothetical protein